MEGAENHSVTCPNCGNSVPALVAVDAGLRLNLEESGNTNVPDQVCANCYRTLRVDSSSGSKLRAEQKAKEEARMRLWNGRVGLVKQARVLMKAKSYSEAAVAYEKYLKSLEIVFEVKPGRLQPEQFKSKARQSELTVISSVYWDLICIYDTSPKYGNRMMKAADKLAEFARFTPLYASIIRKAQSYQKKAKHPKVIKRFLKHANAERPRCFIATAVFDDPWAFEVRTLCAFRDQVLKQSGAGRIFVYWYYKISPPLAETIDRFPFLRAAFRPCLKLAAAQLRRIFNLKTPPEF